MKSYSFGYPISVKGIQYAEMEFDTFIAREVLLNGKPKGEYHIKARDDSSIYNVLIFFKSKFEECDVGLIDPEGLLNLEYPIYILTDSRIIIDSIVEILKEIDKSLNK